MCGLYFFFSSRRRHTRCSRDWSSDVCSSDLVGGGSFPGAKLKTWLVRLNPQQLAPDKLAAKLRANDPPVIARIADDRVVLEDRKSTRLNSSHGYISYAVFCLKKKKKQSTHTCNYKHSHKISPVADHSAWCCNNRRWRADDSLLLDTLETKLS